MKVKLLEIRDEGTFKTCGKCGNAKPLTSEFWYRQSRAKSGFQTYCKACLAASHIAWYRRTSIRPRRVVLTSTQRKHRIRERQNQWRKNNPEAARARDFRSDLRKHYGMTVEGYDLLFKKQHEKCAICGVSKPRRTIRFWHVDHCHKTKKVRGILCSSCNVMIGHAKEDIAVLASASRYLEKHRES